MLFRSHPILFRALAIGMGVLAAASMFEVAVRVGIPWRRSSASLVSVGGEMVTLHPAVSWGYESTPWFGRYGGSPFSQRTQLVPFSIVSCDTHVARGGEPTCRSGRQNSSGFRVPEFTIAHPPNTFRIVIVGDSFTWGDGVELEQTYHRLLQARFDREPVGSGPRVEIVALGVNGSNLSGRSGSDCTAASQASRSAAVRRRVAAKSSTAFSALALALSQRPPPMVSSIGRFFPTPTYRETR